MYWTKRIWILPLALALVAGVAEGKRRNLSKGKLRPTTEVAEAAPLDTVMLPDSITLAAYDKPLRAAQETMFVTNGHGRELTGLRLRIRYLDMSGRQLHERTVDVPLNVPARETRRVNISTWDPQRLYYYHATPPARTSAVPYDVQCRVERALFAR